MKKLVVLLSLFAAFLISCQTKVESTGLNLNTNSIETVVKTEEPKALVLQTPTPEPLRWIDSKIGIADVRDEGKSCLRTKNPDLPEKTPVSIIMSLDEPSPRVLKAAVGKKFFGSCARQNSEDGDKNPGANYFYSLVLTEKLPPEFSGFDIGFAVIEPAKPVQVQNNLASIDLNGDGKPEFFRHCQGGEGFFFTIWTGKPLKGKRIWYSSYYVNYDTVRTCKKKDYEGIED